MLIKVYLFISHQEILKCHLPFYFPDCGVRSHFLKFSFVSLILLSSFSGGAQEWIGLNTDNFAGLYQMQTQPASIAGGPYKFQVNVLGVDFLGFNADFFANLRISKDLRKVLEGSFFDIFQDDREEYLARTDIFAPSFILPLNEKSSIGFFTKARGHFFSKGSDADLNRLIFNDFDLEEFFGRVFNSGFITMRFNTWWEFNFTYAREVLRDDKHVLRLGISPKLVVGQSAGYFSVDNLGFELQDRQTLVNLEGDLRFGFTKSLEDIIQDQGIDFFGKSTLGLNLGIEYEIRSNEISEESLNMKNRYYDPGYDFKFGISLTDFGSTPYAKADKSSDYRADVSNFQLNSLRNIESPAELADTLGAYFDKVQDDSDYKVHLPLTLRFQVDYRLKDHFFVNFSTALAITGKDRAIFETRNLNLYALTLRYEKPKFGLIVPLSYNNVFKLNLGTAVRWGPMVVGSSNLISGLFRKDTQFVNIYTGFNVSAFNQ